MRDVSLSVSLLNKRKKIKSTYKIGGKIIDLMITKLRIKSKLVKPKLGRLSLFAERYHIRIQKMQEALCFRKLTPLNPIRYDMESLGLQDFDHVSLHTCTCADFFDVGYCLNNLSFFFRHS